MGAFEVGPGLGPSDAFWVSPELADAVLEQGDSRQPPLNFPVCPLPPPLSAFPLLPWWCWGLPGGPVAAGTRATAGLAAEIPV